MFFNNGLLKKYNTDQLLIDTDASVHSGIPKKYYNLKDKIFNDWEIPPWELFIFKDKLLGSGTFSNVYLAKWRETFVVAKVINSSLVDFKKHLIEREINIMTRLHHPNIVQFLGFIDNPFVIVMEYIPNGNLQERIPYLNKKTKIKIMINILQGLAYLHKRLPESLIHRDIKPTNIILTSSNFAKITDFGLSKLHCLTKNMSVNDLTALENIKNYTNENSELTDIVGTERYMAPEIKENNNNYTEKIDIYSTGILLYEMFENKKYYKGEKFKWYKCPKKIKQIIVDYMLNDDPNKRLDAIKILKILDYQIK
tara:strand:- start:2461 stop:3393 length:933 start_codon:yes stop_codon:yes gene_type:complete